MAKSTNENRTRIKQITCMYVGYPCNTTIGEVRGPAFHCIPSTTEDGKGDGDGTYTIVVCNLGSHPRIICFVWETAHK